MTTELDYDILNESAEELVEVASDYEGINENEVAAGIQDSLIQYRLAEHPFISNDDLAVDEALETADTTVKAVYSALDDGSADQVKVDRLHNDLYRTPESVLKN